MRVGYYLPGMTPERFRALPLRQRGHVLDALDEWIERLNSETEEAATKSTPMDDE